MNNLAWYYVQIDKDLARALQYARRANELAGDNPSFLDTLAEVRYRMGEAGRAEALERFTLEATTAAYCRLYAGVLARPGSRVVLPTSR